MNGIRIVINLSATGTLVTSRSKAQSRLTSESSESLLPETTSKRKATEGFQSPAKRANTRPTGSSATRSMPPHAASDDPGHESADDSEDGSEGEGNWRMARLPTDLRTVTELKGTPEQVQLCLERDGRRCVVTGSRIPQAAHIVPMVCDINLHTSMEELDEEHSQAFIIALSLEHFGIPLNKFPQFRNPWTMSDEPGNMISLSPSLHRAWSKGYFGLKPIGLAPFLDGKARMGEVAFKLVWLPRASYKAFANPIDICKEHPSDPESLVAQLRESTRPEGLHFMNAKTKGPVKSGQFFHVNRPYEEAEKLKDLLAVQWTLIRIAAMSGAADAVQYGLDPSKDPDRVVITWLADQVGRYYDTEDIEDLLSEAVSDKIEVVEKC